MKKFLVVLTALLALMMFVSCEEATPEDPEEFAARTVNAVNEAIAERKITFEVSASGKASMKLSGGAVKVGDVELSKLSGSVSLSPYNINFKLRSKIGDEKFNVSFTSDKKGFKVLVGGAEVRFEKGDLHITGFGK